MTKSIRLRLEPLESRDTPSVGYFRFVSYNIAASNGSPASGLDTVLQAIGAERSGSLAQAIDLLALQEVRSQSTTTQAVVNLLNGIYGAGVYARGSLDGATTGSGTQGIVYNTQTLQLLGEAAVGTTSTSGQPRQTMRYRLRPVGASADAEFYVYNGHFKADDDSTSESRRLVEANAIRANADALGQGVQVLYVGDFNVYRNTDSSFQRLISAGNGQAFDPPNRMGNWHENAGFRDVFTQAPAVNPPSGLTGGGLDDRFDFQLFSDELTDGAGLDYVAGTYRSFGNNGSVPLNGNINSVANTALSELPNRIAVLNLLTTVTDHLPVVADYRIVGSAPAVANVVIGDGTTQRSRITQLNVVFDQAISTLGSPSDAFSLQRIVDGAPAGNVGFNVTLSTVGNRTEALITFTSDTFGGSLNDGRYRLIVAAGQVLAGGRFMAADSVTNFHRLFGDANGDARVNIQDYGLFSLSFNLGVGEPGYNAAFDFDGNGRVNIADFGQFSLRYSTMLP